MRVQKWFPVFLFLILFVSIVFLGTGCDSLKGPKGDKGDSGTSGGATGSWQNATSVFEDNLCMIGIIDEFDDFVTHIGTGWAIAPDKIITNAHVAYGVYDVCRDAGLGLDGANDRIVAVKNNTYTGEAGTFELIECAVHTGYNNLNPFSNDFAVFTIDTNGFSGAISISGASTLQALYVGQYVGTMGYPGELSGGFGDEYMPIATFKDGTISALRPYSQLPPQESIVPSFSFYSASSIQTSTDRPIIQYNFNTTGGTSGSPVFLQSGEVVAINNSGMEVYVEDAEYGNIVRVGLGSLNFGIRIDQMTDIANMPYKTSVSNFRDTDPSEYSTLSSGQYRVNFDWDSWYDFDLYVLVGDNSQLIGGFIDPSRAYIYPFVVHHGDSWGYGPEKATLLQLVKDVKIFGYKYSYDGSFSTSMATCQITSANGVVAELNSPPAGYADFWIIGTLHSDGTFTETNELTNEDPLLQASTIVQDHLKAFGVDISQCEREILKTRK
jgi:V8-like Glu-specific endopeptidase